MQLLGEGRQTVSCSVGEREVSSRGAAAPGFTRKLVGSTGNGCTILNAAFSFGFIEIAFITQFPRQFPLSGGSKDLPFNSDRSGRSPVQCRYSSPLR